MRERRKVAAESIARSVGQMLLDREAHKDLKIEEKSVNDFVTEADTTAEQMIIEYLSAQFPDDGFLGEEQGERGSDAPRWVIDPIDGTVNYIRGMPNYTISIGWEEEPGNPIVGVVYNVRQDEMFSAVVGSGAYCNGKPISVSAIDDPARAIIICEAPHRKKQWAGRYWQLFSQIFQGCSDLRTFGSIALELCYMASGRLDMIFQYDLGYWDIAAGAAILKEAGGIIEPIEPQKNLSVMPCDIIATNGLLHPWISQQVRDFGSIRD
jgi:myo-inositol-1(or 4)-monophosphatase